MHPYFPHTPEDVSVMLSRCGAASVDDLYADVPAELLLGRDYDLPPAQSEKEVRDFFNSLGRKNRQLTCFAGAGFYDKFAPAAIANIISRSEFLTAYTPYQSEISQGTLQYIFEYQSMIAGLTGLDVSNASLYDGATAAAEAMMMAVASVRKADRVLASATLNPAVVAVVRTYARHHGIRLDVIPAKDGVTDLEQMRLMLREGGVAGVMVPQPNFYGIIEDLTGVADACHEVKALLIMHCTASTLGVLRTPGEWGADIACGDAQSLGMPLSFGGPYLGFLCCTKALMRKLPGRVVGATKDESGRRCFVLTLQAREQHIRREKATSNICSNQGLMALYASIYLSLMGPEGLREVNLKSAQGAHYLAEALEATGVMRLTYPERPYLNEFLMTCSVPAQAVIDAALERGILAGVRVADHELLIAVTEMRTRAEMDALVDIVSSLKPSAL